MSGAEAVTITTITENYVDMLLAHEHGVERAGLVHHFDPKRSCPIGENGVALHVEVEYGGGRRYRVLFDTGMTYPVLAHNAAALGVDLDQVDHVVISHGHPDHYGGLLGLLKQRSAPVPVAIHEQAFGARYLRVASGEVAPYYNHDLTHASVGEAGGRAVLQRGVLEVGPGLLASGAIPREVAFENPAGDVSAPNALIQLVDGEMAYDFVPDDQALYVLLGKSGLVVLVGCSHAGIVNTINHALAATGRQHVVAVVGGFHLGFPGTPQSKTAQTIEAFHSVTPTVLCPMHCTGMRAMMEIAAAFPDQFLLNCTGTRLHLDQRGRAAFDHHLRQR